MKRRILIAVILCLALLCSGASAKLVFPSSLEEISDRAFYNDKTVKLVTLPDTIKRIGSRAFGKTSLKSIYLPPSLEYIADDAFYGCPSTMVVTADKGSYAYEWAVAHGYMDVEYVIISGGNCNVRTAPNTSAEILGVAHAGDTLPYLGETSSAGWLKVEYNGQTGWVSGKYGSLLDDSPTTGTAIVDISKWQGDIDFDELKPAVALVIARACNNTTVDTRIVEYMKEMTKRNIPFGVYCYSTATTKAGIRNEVKTMYNIASPYDPLFYVMDAESDGTTAALIAYFADCLRAIGAEKIGCYCGHAHYTQYNYDSVRDKFDFTWIPRYGKDDGTLEASIKPKYECDLWQYTSKGKLPGISTDCDLNIITGTGHTLSWFLS